MVGEKPDADYFMALVDRLYAAADKAFSPKQEGFAEGDVLVRWDSPGPESVAVCEGPLELTRLDHDIVTRLEVKTDGKKPYDVLRDKVLAAARDDLAEKGYPDYPLKVEKFPGGPNWRVLRDDLGSRARRFLRDVSQEIKLLYSNHCSYTEDTLLFSMSGTGDGYKVTFFPDRFTPSRETVARMAAEIYEACSAKG